MNFTKATKQFLIAKFVQILFSPSRFSDNCCKEFIETKLEVAKLLFYEVVLNSKCSKVRGVCNMSCGFKRSYSVITKRKRQRAFGTEISRGANNYLFWIMVVMDLLESLNMTTCFSNKSKQIRPIDFQIFGHRKQ